MYIWFLKKNKLRIIIDDEHYKLSVENMILDIQNILYRKKLHDVIISDVEYLSLQNNQFSEFNLLKILEGRIDKKTDLINFAAVREIKRSLVLRNNIIRKKYATYLINEEEDYAEQERQEQEEHLQNFQENIYNEQNDISSLSSSNYSLPMLSLDPISPIEDDLWLNPDKCGELIIRLEAFDKKQEIHRKQLEINAERLKHHNKIISQSTTHTFKKLRDVNKENHQRQFQNQQAAEIKKTYNNFFKIYNMLPNKFLSTERVLELWMAMFSLNPIAATTKLDTFEDIEPHISISFSLVSYSDISFEDNIYANIEALKECLLLDIPQIQKITSTMDLENNNFSITFENAPLIIKSNLSSVIKFALINSGLESYYQATEVIIYEPVNYSCTINSMENKAEQIININPAKTVKLSDSLRFTNSPIVVSGNAHKALANEVDKNTRHSDNKTPEDLLLNSARNVL